MYEEIQRSVHGPDFKATALLLGKQRGGKGASVSAAAAVASVSAAAAAKAQSGREAQHSRVSGQDPSRDAAWDLPQPPVEQFAVFTPRGAGVLPALEAGSPDRLLNLPGAEAVWEEDGAACTEATDDREEREERLSLRLARVEGADAFHVPGVEFVVHVDQLLPDYRALYGDWLEGDPATRSGCTLKQLSLIHI